MKRGAGSRSGACLAAACHNTHPGRQVLASTLRCAARPVAIPAIQADRCRGCHASGTSEDRGSVGRSHKAACLRPVDGVGRATALTRHPANEPSRLRTGSVAGPDKPHFAGCQPDRPAWASNPHARGPRVSDEDRCASAEQSQPSDPRVQTPSRLRTDPWLIPARSSVGGLHPICPHARRPEVVMRSSALGHPRPVQVAGNFTQKRFHLFVPESNLAEP